jgi:hypothetical protein
MIDIDQQKENKFKQIFGQSTIDLSKNFHSIIKFICINLFIQMNFVKLVGMEFLNNIAHKHGNYFVYGIENFFFLFIYLFVSFTGLSFTENRTKRRYTNTKT